MYLTSLNYYLSKLRFLFKLILEHFLVVRQKGLHLMPCPYWFFDWQLWLATISVFFLRSLVLILCHVLTDSLTDESLDYHGNCCWLQYQSFSFYFSSFDGIKYMNSVCHLILWHFLFSWDGKQGETYGCCEIQLFIKCCVLIDTFYNEVSVILN